MTIQFNTDKNINGNEDFVAPFITQIEDELRRFNSHITRIEVHLSDQNGKKEGAEDIRCLMEARLEGRQPIAATCQAGNVERALSGAIEKLKASLETILGRISNH